MFNSQDVLDMTITADFTEVNTMSKEAADQAADSWEDAAPNAKILLGKDGNAKPLEAYIVPRGNARFDECGYRPFALKFKNKEQLKGTPFHHLGKSVKFVTHCGDKDGMSPTFKADSITAYEQRVVMEHAVYQMLDQLEVPSLKTRLVRIMYQDTHQSGSAAQTGAPTQYLAFVREPEDKMAERCGLVETEDLKPDDGPFVANQYSNMLLHLLNAFVRQTDWDAGRNTLRLFDVERKQALSAPYDFDLVGIFRPDYWRNANAVAKEADRSALTNWLRRNQSPALFREVGVLLSRRERLREVLAEVGLSDENRRLFFDPWFDETMNVLDEFRSCEGHANDSSRTNCHVPDDHGDSPDTATPMNLGQWTTRLEPPGDVDTFALHLQAGTLYSLTGNSYLELRHGQGMLLAKSDPNTFMSVRPTETGTTYLSASLSDALVVSELRPSVTQIDRPIVIYEDDHGSTPETATPLGPEKAVDGKWEMKTGYDEDWFLVSADSHASLHITLAEPDDWVFGSSGRVQVVSRTSLDALSAEADLLGPGEHDLPSLFAEQGEYIVKVIQSGDSARYLIRLSP